MTLTPELAPAAPPAGLRPGAAHSRNEWSPLREVIVGTAAGARLPDPSDISAWLNLYPELADHDVTQIRGGTFSTRIVEETEEDLEQLAMTLRQLGVRVHRPAPAQHAARFATPHWSAPGGFSSYCPRDLALVVGSAIIESPSPMRARAHELDPLKPLFTRALRAGSPWLAAPRPQLHDDLYGIDGAGRPVLGELEPAFEAANVLRLGDDLLYLISSSGNELGRCWLQTTLDTLGHYRVHPIRDVYAGTHLDSTLAPIRPGLVLANPARVTPENLPAPLAGWEVLWCPPMSTPPDVGDGPTRPPLSSAWIGMNLLMVTPDLAIVDAAQPALHQLLRSRRVEVIPLTLRHAHTLGGGFHCVTLDLVRTEDPSDPFSIPGGTRA